MLLHTPLGALIGGIVAGLVATLLLSVLARVVPGMQNRPGGGRRDGPSLHEANARRTDEIASAMSPANILRQPQAPGPEGLAQQFAFKVGSGLFAKDISPYERPAGFVVHIVYGSLWGALFGLIQATFHWMPLLFGALYGLAVWLIGPALLVPAMKILSLPWKGPPLRTTAMFLGHLVYGMAVALVFAFLESRVA